jgi:hypothetical protein
MARHIKESKLAAGAIDFSAKDERVLDDRYRAI